MQEFIHLHNHSDLSLLDGAMSVGQIVDRAIELNMNAIALTEHGNMLSTIAFYKAATSKGIKPIIGCEIYVTEDRFHKKPGKRGRGNYTHLVLLAMNNNGYKNLVKIVSKGYTEGFYTKPRVDKQVLREFSDDLICLSACIAGEPQQEVIEGNYEKAREVAVEYAEIFPGRFYLEVQNHGLDDEKKWIKAAKKISSETGIPRVATNDAHYAKKEHWEAHDVHICIGMQKEFDDPNRIRYEPFNYWIKSQEEMEEAFSNDAEVFENTVKIAEQCNVTFKFGDYYLPKFTLPEGYESQDEYLRFLVFKGLEGRYDTITDEIKERTEYELKVISDMGFAGYFLITQDFVIWAKDHHIPVGPGRGSAAGSIVCYATKITDIDPLPFDLLFERFLNPERVSMPDIDIDFDDERRPLVIEYIKEKYGRDCVCNIVTFGKMKAKGVLRDVGRVLGIPISEVETIIKIFDESGKKNLQEAYKDVKELHKKAEENRKYKKLFDIALVLEGKHRQHGIHAAGIVIAPDDLTKYLPIQVGKESTVTTQYDMKCIDDMGLLKIDFLGLRNLSVIDRTVEMLKEKNIFVDINNISMDDKKTYELFSSGKTIGVFQFESPGMREYLSKLKPNRLDDLIAMNALYRPGPMANIEIYIQRKHGEKEIVYDHLKLEPILKSTYGIIVYQEQVMQIGQAIGNFTLAKADNMRRAMGKKKMDVMNAMKKEFVDGAVEQDINAKVASDLFDTVTKFAEYGFNKSHSAAYAYLAYQIGYLKAHYPAEFLAANLTSEMNDIDRVVILSNEVTSLGMELLPPNINFSEVHFKPEGKGIRYGLNAIKNVGKNAAKNIVENKNNNGPFESFFKFVDNLDLRIVNKKALEALIFSGATDDCEGTRSQKFASIDEAVKHARKLQEEQNTNQISLFEMETSGPNSIIAEPKLPAINPMKEKECLIKEKEQLGLYISGHPLIKHSQELRILSNYHFDKPLSQYKLGYVKTGGMITTIQIRLDRRGNKFATMTLEGLEGSIGVTLFSSVYESCREFLKEDATIFVEGRPDMSFGDGKIIADKVIPLKDALSRKINKVHIYVPNTNFSSLNIQAIKNMFMEHQGDSEIFFHVYDKKKNKKTVRVKDLKINPTLTFLEKLYKKIGKEYIKFEQ